MAVNSELPEIRHSHVVSLYDYHQSEIPDELRLWRVRDDEIQTKLTELAARQTAYAPAASAAAGDGVRCTCINGCTLNGRTKVLLYPGQTLPGAEAAEQAVLDHAVGDEFETELAGAPITLRVEEILRKQPAPPVSDALVKAAGIDGVDSIAAYARWYREQNEGTNRMHRISQLSSFWFQEVAAHSEVSIDPDEQEAYASVLAQQIFDDMVRCGIDPHIPEEGTELLSDEQAIAQYKQGALDEFRYTLIQQAFIHANSLDVVTEEDVRVACQDTLDKSGMEKADYLTCTGMTEDEFAAQIRESIPADRMWAMLKQEAEAYMEA